MDSRLQSIATIIRVSTLITITSTRGSFSRTARIRLSSEAIPIFLEVGRSIWLFLGMGQMGEFDSLTGNRMELSFASISIYDLAECSVLVARAWHIQRLEPSCHCLL